MKSQSEGADDENEEEAPLGSSESKSMVENAELESPPESASPVVPDPKQNYTDKSSSTKGKQFVAKPRKAKRKRTKPLPRPPTDSVSAVLKASIVTSEKAKDKSPRPLTPTPPFPLTSVFSPDEEPSFAQLSKFSLLLENRTFVDYLNVFLSLPIFGQHVYYNFLEKTFEFEPPILQENVIFTDQHRVLCWLYNRRFEFFQKTSLYFEFLMTSELKTAKICIQGIPEKELHVKWLRSPIQDGTDDTENTSNLCKNLFGSVVGMMLFRESLRNTCGERVFSCWRDIARWSCLEDHDPEKLSVKNQIKAKYISNGSNDLLPERSLKLVLEGKINAEILPDEELLLDVLEITGFEDRVFVLDSESSFTKLQKIMMCALTMYWVKRYVAHLQTTVPLEKLRLLFRPPPGEEVSVARERKLRCLQMFPSVFLKANIDASLTSIQVLNSTHTTEEAAEQKISQPLDDAHTHATSDIKQELSKHRDLICSEESISSDCRRHELIDKEESAMWKTLTSRQSHKTSAPIIVSSFMTGTRNMFSVGYPYPCNRIMWSLASDILSGSPFKTYLKEYGQALDLHYLQFWTDVRNYLSADDLSCDVIGNSTKNLLFYKIAKTYLISGGEASDIFSESLQMSLLRDLSNHNDTSLMHVANDIVIQALWEPMQSYIKADRKTFLNRLRENSSSILTYEQKQKQQAGFSVDQSADNVSNPMYSFKVENRARGRTDVPSCSLSHGFYHSDNSKIPNRAKSSKQDHTDQLKEQMWRALEFAILCTEYGNKGMGPQVVPGIDVLVDSLHGDYGGSLHIRKQQPPIRNDWLCWLLKKPKIDIQKIQVSRKPIIENLLVLPKKVVRTQQTTTLLLKRRNAMLLERPPRPRSLEDVLRSKEQYEFFKRFLSLKNALLPLLFWREVEDLKNMPYIKNRRMRVLYIFRKFFGQSTQYGALLDCDEEIIKQLPFMDKVTPALLFCAQNAVFEVLERKWFSAYLDTFPPDFAETRIPNPDDEQSQDATKKDMLLGRSRKGKKKRSSRSPMNLWRSFCRILLKFRRGLNQHETFIKFQTYLEVDAEQEQNKKVVGIQKSVDGKKTASVLQTTPLVKKKTVQVLKNQLPQDLSFWMEILRYMDLVDSVKASGETSTEHAQILIDKATAIVTVYLVSEVPPRVQVNISEDMASVILSSLQTVGPTRGLFHEAIMRLFPLLYISWKTFCQKELAGTLPEEYFLRLYKKITRAVPTISPHKNESFPDYLHIKDDCVTIIHGAVASFEESMRITFSIMEGIRYFICSKDVYDVEREREEQLMAKRQKESPNQLRSPTRSLKQSGDGRLQHFTRADSLVVGEQDRSKRRRSSLPSSQTALDSYSHNEGHVEGDKHRVRRLSKLLDDTPNELIAVVKETKKRRGNRRVSKPQN